MKKDFRYYLENFFKENKILKISNGLITIILSSFIILIINLLFFTPEIHGYDEMAKWSAGKKFIENFEINTNHHSMRWGAWITTLFFQSLENAPLAYYIHNLLVLHISLIIFAYVIFKLAGIIPSIIFLIITHYYDEILWSGFQSDISISTFLPLSIIILLIHKDIMKNAGTLLKYNNFYFLFFTFACFFLYAVKETNLFFIPGILFFIFIYYGLKKCIKFILIFVFFYFLETIFFKYFISGDFSNYGRIIELIFGKTLSQIQSEFAGAGVISFSELILKRWYYSGRGWIYLITLIGFIFFFLKYFKKKNKKTVEIFIILTVLSFYLFHTFFITSLKPLVPGQVFSPRYNLVIFPICTGFISILIFNILFLNKSNLIKIISILTFTYLIQPTFNYMSSANSIVVRHVWNNKELNNIFLYDSIISRIKYYNKLKILIKSENHCFTSKVHPRLYAIPFIVGNLPYHAIYDEHYIEDKWIVSYKGLVHHCKNILNLDFD